MKKILALGIVLVGCDGTLPGESGNLSLSYTHGGLFESVSNPIAAGLKADVIIRDAESGDAAAISDAYADDSAVLAVSSIEGGTMDLSGLGEGDTILNVEADGLMDTFPIAVRTIGTVSYGDPVGAGDAAYSVASGSTIWIPRTVRDENGDELTGYGLSLPDGGTAAAGVEDGAIGSTLVRFTEVGEASLVYSGEASGENQPSVYTVVDSAAATWEVSDAVEATELTVGDVRAISVVGSLDGAVVYGSIATNDEAICSAVALLGAAEVYTLTANAAGSCSVYLNGDSTAALEYTIAAE